MEWSLEEIAEAEIRAWKLSEIREGCDGWEIDESDWAEKAWDSAVTEWAGEYSKMDERGYGSGAGDPAQTEDGWALYSGVRPRDMAPANPSYWELCGMASGVDPRSKWMAYKMTQKMWITYWTKRLGV